MNPRKTLAALVTALTIGVAVAGPALAVNADLAGRPDALHVDGELAPTGENFLGADASHPAENPFVELR